LLHWEAVLGHAWLHEPQLLLSEFVFTQLVPHNEVVLSQVVPHTLFVHVATVCAPVALQSVVVQHAGAAMPMQVLPPGQTRWPLGHVPLQAAFCAMHVPLQFWGRLDGQA
jgi:hypothetical protein